MNKVFVVCLVVLACAACRKPSPDPIASLLQNKKGAVFVFLAPDCPLSQNYTLTLNNLNKEFESAGVGFYGVFSGGAISKQAMDDFAATYHLGFPAMLDDQSKVADYFGATTTPEAFLTGATGQTVYKGAIDNWAPELGQHRTVITQHYLFDALESVRAGKAIQVKETQAVGCFIERKNQS
ncbi:MAG TPA: redoxin domain-containing protein [Terriglobia bacterium]|jgi:thiol-disulfide isomerase/thioredoxin